MGEKIRVLYLAYYPAALLKDQLVLDNDNIQHPASWVVNLIRAVSRLPEVELHVVAEAMNIPYDQDVAVETVHYHFIKAPKTLNLSTLYYLNRRRLIRKLREIRPDVVHAHGCEGSVGLAGVDAGYPCLLSMQGVLTEIAKAEKQWLGKTTLRLQLSGMIERNVVRRAKYIGTRTEFDTAFVKRTNPEARIFYAPEAMNDAFFEVTPSLESRNIVYVGSLIERKDPLTLIRALKIIRERFPDCKLVVVGTGSDEYIRKVKKEVDHLGLHAHLEFAGLQPHSVLTEIFQNAALLVLPSVIENSPNTVAEAMCAGLPVVATDVGGVSSLIENGVTGILVQPRQPNELAAAIMELLSDHDLRKRMGAAGREKAKRTHVSHLVANRMVEIYREILEIENRG